MKHRVCKSLALCRVQGKALALLLALSSCGYTPAQLGITGPHPNAMTAATPPLPGGNSDAQAAIPGVQTGDALYAAPSVRTP